MKSLESDINSEDIGTSQKTQREAFIISLHIPLIIKLSIYTIYNIYINKKKWGPFISGVTY